MATIQTTLSNKVVLEDNLPVVPTTTGGTTTGVVAAAASAVIKAGAGRLCRVLVTAAGTAALTFYDSAASGSGTVVGLVPANAAVGTVYDLQMPCQNGIYAAGGVGSPGVTVSYI